MTTAVAFPGDFCKESQQGKVHIDIRAIKMAMATGAFSSLAGFMLVTSAKPSADALKVEWTGFSPLFDELEPGEPIPTYVVMLSRSVEDWNLQFGVEVRRQ